MKLSYITLDRFATKHRPIKNPRMVLADARELSDQKLIAKLESLGIILDKETLEELCNEYISAQELSEYLVTKYNISGKFIQPAADTDWVWFCITILWERWFKNIPNLEMIDDKMQMGYSESEKNHAVQGCEIWFSYWNDVLTLMKKWEIASIEEFEMRFVQTQSVYNWCQDFEMELHNASLRDVRYNQIGIDFCEKIISLIDQEEKSIIENMREAIAESYYNMGEVDKTDELYQEWLEADPKWGWGWICWSDLYWLFSKKECHNPQKAEKILTQAIEIEDIRDKRDVLERLSDFYRDINDIRKKDEIDQQIASLIKDYEKTDSPLLNEGAINDLLYSSPELNSSKEFQRRRRKIGRNEPCPCGSGKKYKKCCGRTDR
jgi:tetratricopeptide (TPR) repeat protein